MKSVVPHMLTLSCKHVEEALQRDVPMTLLAHLVVSVELPLIHDDAHDSLVTIVCTFLLLFGHLEDTSLAEDDLSFDLKLL